MKQKYIFPLSVLVLYAHIHANVQPITPGEALYGIVSRIGTSMDQANSGISTIETQLQSISGSSIDTLSSVVENLGSNIDTLVENTNTLSAQDVLIYNMTTQIDSKVDSLAVAVNNVSVQDALIYNTTTQVDSKVDTLTIAVNNVSVQDALIYNTVTEIDSKIDLLKGFPDFVQTPTTFASVSIDSNTSRYFYQSALLQPAGVTEVPILSIKNNSSSTVVRISALGGGVVQNPSGIFGVVKFYKNPTLTGASFTSVYPGESIMVQDTSATAFSGGKPVFQVANVFSAAGGASDLPLVFIPKESYSITVLPGETLTATVQGIGTSSVHQAIMLWEEIIVA